MASVSIHGIEKVIKLSNVMLCALISTAALVASAATPPSKGHQQDNGLVVRYTFDRVEGDVVPDTSGHDLNGTIVGHVDKVAGMHGAALRFDGVSYVRVPGGSLRMEDNVARGGKFTLAAWVKGKGSRFRLIVPPSTYPSLRGPHFQVVGDRIYFATNSDQPSAEDPTRMGNFRGLWNDWQLWTGSVNVNLTGWKDVQRTFPPKGGVEPKVVAAGGQLFYQYFGRDSTGVLQFYTAYSDLDGSDWKSIQRTHNTEGYRAEQTYNIQAVGGRIYAAWWQSDKTGILKPWFGSYDMDGSDFRSVRLSPEHSYIPSMQVVEDKIYFMYSDDKFNWAGDSTKTEDYHENLTFGVSGLDGSDYRIVRRIPISWVPNAQGEFRISGGKVYMLIYHLSHEGYSHLYTAQMNLDGSNFKEIQRTTGRTNALGEGPGRVQIVGSKVHYVYTVDDGASSITGWMTQSLKQRHAAGLQTQIWVASEDLDGGNWRAEPKTPFMTNLLVGYRALQVVGGKSYFAAQSDPKAAAAGKHAIRWQPMLGTSGSNIISKGDAYGIGLDESGLVSGFVNAGEDYLYRAEAPSDTAGALVAAPLDEQWHYVAVTYDRNSLRLYVDGRLVGEHSYRAKIGLNAFPILLGDGFEGLMDEVEIYGRAASADEIRRWSRRYEPARN